jgi:hypothetical protein
VRLPGRDGEADEVGSAAVRTASRRLLGAVLRRALEDATGPLRRSSTACSPPDREGARAWLASPCIEPMSFRWLCLMLDLDPDAILKRVVTRPAGLEQLDHH